MIIESKFVVNCHHFIYFYKCNKNKIIFAKLHCFFFLLLLFFLVVVVFLFCFVFVFFVFVFFLGGGVLGNLLTPYFLLILVYRTV